MYNRVNIQPVLNRAGRPRPDLEQTVRPDGELGFAVDENPELAASDGAHPCHLSDRLEP